LIKQQYQHAARTWKMVSSPQFLNCAVDEKDINRHLQPTTTGWIAIAVLLLAASGRGWWSESGICQIVTDLPWPGLLFMIVSQYEKLS